MAKALGGDLSVRSTREVGSDFTFSLCGAVAEAPSHPAAALPSHELEHLERTIRGARIFLAEDQRDIAFVVCRHLENAGATVVHAPDGLRAVARFEEGVFDLALLDLQMPGLSGTDVARRIRAAGWRGPLIAFTANAEFQSREACLAGGFDDFAAKPLPRADLLRLVAGHLEKRTTQDPDAPDSTGREPRADPRSA